VRKKYQNNKADTSQPAVPEQVSVALGELVGEVGEGLLALAVGTGLQVLSAMMEADVTAACGVRGRHDPARTATRHGHEAGSVSLGGRRVPVSRPRMRASDGSGELPVATYELFSGTEVLGRMAMQRMLAGLSTRRYPLGLEPVGARVEQAATATSRSAVSRRFAATETALAELLQQVAPESRVVYVDNDPLVLAHATALMVTTPPGATDYIDADLNEPDQILHGAARTLDFNKPIAVTLLGILEFITDNAHAYGILKRLVDCMVSGSHLVIAQPTTDIDGEAMRTVEQLWNDSGAVPAKFRSRDEFSRFFNGLELLEPGVVTLTQWRPDPAPSTPIGSSVSTARWPASLDLACTRLLPTPPARDQQQPLRPSGHREPANQQHRQHRADNHHAQRGVGTQAGRLVTVIGTDP
jgi:hypothetical protein